MFTQGSSPRKGAAIEDGDTCEKGRTVPKGYNITGSIRAPYVFMMSIHEDAPDDHWQSDANEDIEDLQGHDDDSTSVTLRLQLKEPCQESIWVVLHQTLIQVAPCSLAAAHAVEVQYVQFMLRMLHFGSTDGFGYAGRIYDLMAQSSGPCNWNMCST